MEKPTYGHYLAPRIWSHRAITGEAFPLLITDALICTGIFLAGSTRSWRRDDKKSVKQSWENRLIQAHKSSNSLLPLLSGSSCRREKNTNQTIFYSWTCKKTQVKRAQGQLYMTKQQTNTEQGVNINIFPLRQAKLECLVLAQINLL